MKKFTIFESSVIGLFVGVVIASYLTFLTDTGGFVGKIISTVSLQFLLVYFPHFKSNELLIPFVFCVGVYVLYGALLGGLIRSSRKVAGVIILLMVLLIGGAAYEQMMGVKPVDLSAQNDMQVAAVVRSVPKQPEQYFGTEALGDLNQDGRDDRVYLLTRDEEEGEVNQYRYLGASLKSDKGFIGTNILYLGKSFNPTSVVISDGMIEIDYSDPSLEDATSTLKMYAKVVDGKLMEATTTSH